MLSSESIEIQDPISLKTPYQSVKSRQLFERPLLTLFDRKLMQFLALQFQLKALNQQE